jgi:GTP-binding protein
MSENGEPGETRIIKCELKVLADVGLIGLPSVGKSTLLSVISASKPKIAAYHFTTLNPNLGVVNLKDGREFIMADLPGLIEGASEGLGLGLKFLRHATRCKVLAHVIDMGAEEGRNPIDDYEIIDSEIKKYGHNLNNKPTIIIANKMDLPNAENNLKAFTKKYPKLEIIPISAFSLDGVEICVKKLADALDKYIAEPIYKDEDYEENVIIKFKNEKPYTITKKDDVWVLSGDKIEKLFKMTKFTEVESQLRFAKILKSMGVEDELLKLGAQKGDTVAILDYLFQFKD